MVVSRGSEALLVAVKLKFGGVPWFRVVACSYEVEVPPAKAWWCAVAAALLVVMKLKYHRLKPRGVQTHA